MPMHQQDSKLGIGVIIGVTVQIVLPSADRQDRPPGRSCKLGPGQRKSRRGEE